MDGKELLNAADPRARDRHNRSDAAANRMWSAAGNPKMEFSRRKNAP